MSHKLKVQSDWRFFKKQQENTCLNGYSWFRYHSRSFLLWSFTSQGYQVCSIKQDNWSGRTSADGSLCCKKGWRKKEGNLTILYRKISTWVNSYTSSAILLFILLFLMPIVLFALFLLSSTLTIQRSPWIQRMSLSKSPPLMNTKPALPWTHLSPCFQNTVLNLSRKTLSYGIDSILLMSFF